MKVSDLEGEKLDYWVAKAEGIVQTMGDREVWASPFNPSVDWLHGGPIIQKHGINLSAYPLGGGVTGWCATHAGFFKTGNTTLLAAMRCFVSMKFGEEVE